MVAAMVVVAMVVTVVAMQRWTGMARSRMGGNPRGVPMGKVGWVEGQFKRRREKARTRGQEVERVERLERLERVAVGILRPWGRCTCPASWSRHC
jgi:hypothetical protein